jgi:ribosome modulation factor
MKPVDAGRVIRHYTQRIEARPETVFPLVCPVREAEWLEGWRDALRMVHSDSGLAEDGCVFETRGPDRPETVWMITRHDPTARVVEFFRITTGLVATRLCVVVEGADGDSSSVDITYTHTPLSAEGRSFVERTYAEDAFRKAMAFWEDSMNHWLSSGQLLQAAARS